MIGWLRQPRRRAPSPPPPARVARPTIAVAGRELPLAIRRLSSARRMTLRLAPDGSEARLTLPPWGRIADAVAFARDRSDWLERQLAVVPAAAPPQPGEALPYRGSRLRIDWRAGAPRKPAIGDDAVILGGPEETVSRRLQRWLEGEALRLAQADAADYAARAGMAPPPLRLSRARRRWGSCAGDGTVRINWRLIMAPDAVRRSVVAHEIAHRVHFHHGPAFHRLLAELFEGDLAAANCWLKRDGATLYAPFG
ncbi:MAG: YgjP-like metallopeptidase domain-containing protein [Novosphingobium sp.]